jgi:hypothetical protein
MTTKLKKSTHNAIILFCLSIVSNLIIDYQVHGFPPSVNVLYASLLFALFAFLTTMGTQTHKDRKEKKEARKRGIELEKIIESKTMETSEPPQKIESYTTDCGREDDWIPVMVI